MTFLQLICPAKARDQPVDEGGCFMVDLARRVLSQVTQESCSNWSLGRLVGEAP